MNFRKSERKPRGQKTKVLCFTARNKRPEPKEPRDMASEANRIIDVCIEEECGEARSKRKRRAVFRAVIIASLLGLTVAAGVAAVLIF